MAEAGVEFGEGMAPNYELRIEGLSLSAGVTQFIERVEYESADGLVDMMKISVMNPDSYMSELKLFLPGNEMALWFGYGPDLTFVGRAVIVNVPKRFPRDGMPGLTVTGYTRDHLMMEQQPDPEEEDAKKKAQKKAVWNDFAVSDVVTIMANSYGFQPDVDEAPKMKGNFYHSRDMSDFDFVNKLSNLVGYYWWVDGDEDGKWWLHFKSPETVGPSVQEKVYTFKYNSGDDTTLLAFEPDMFFKDHFTKVVAELTLPSGRVIRKAFVESKESEWATKPKTESELAEDILGTAASIKLYIKDFAISIPATDGIRDEATLEWWADTWIKRHRQEFVSGKGQVIGLESLRARQSHKIKNVDKVSDGSWFFSRVRHIMNSGSGYDCDFSARKEIL